MRRSAESKDFPFHVKYGNIIPEPNPKTVHKVRISPINYYNNESPSMFRLDSMVENKNGYNNPFLDEVLHIDRNEEFKKMDFNRQQINLIDKIKSRREYSQNPNILRYIRSEFDISMQEKRERNIIERNKVREDRCSRYTENEPDEHKKQLYKETIAHLHKNNSHKLSYRNKRKLNLDKLEPICDGKYNISEYDKDTYKTLTCTLEPKKSSYLKNVNDFHISEAEHFDNTKMSLFEQKPIEEYNPMKDQIETVQPPPQVNKKWDAFYEK